MESCLYPPSATPYCLPANLNLCLNCLAWPKGCFVLKNPLECSAATATAAAGGAIKAHLLALALCDRRRCCHNYHTDSPPPPSCFLCPLCGDYKNIYVIAVIDKRLAAKWARCADLIGLSHKLIERCCGLSHWTHFAPKWWQLYSKLVLPEPSTGSLVHWSARQQIPPIHASSLGNVSYEYTPYTSYLSPAPPPARAAVSFVPPRDYRMYWQSGNRGPPTSSVEAKFLFNAPVHFYLL